MNLFIMNYLILIEIGILKWATAYGYRVKGSAAYFGGRTRSLRSRDPSFGYNDDNLISQNVPTLSIEYEEPDTAATDRHVSKYYSNQYNPFHFNQESHHASLDLSPLQSLDFLKISRKGDDEEIERTSKIYRPSILLIRGKNKLNVIKFKRKPYHEMKPMGVEKAKTIETFKTMKCSGLRTVPEPIFSPSQQIPVNRSLESSPLENSLVPSETNILKGLIYSSNHKVYARPWKMKMGYYRKNYKNRRLPYGAFTNRHNLSFLKSRKKNKILIKGNKKGRKSRIMKEEKIPTGDESLKNQNVKTSSLTNTLKENLSDLYNDSNESQTFRNSLDEMQYNVHSNKNFPNVNLKATGSESSAEKPVDFVAVDSFVVPQKIKVHSMHKFSEMKKERMRKLNRNQKAKKKRITLAKAKQPPSNESQNEISSAVKHVNSLTTAHFAEKDPMPFSEPKTELREPLNINQVFNFMRANKTFRFENIKPTPADSGNDSEEWNSTTGRQPKELYHLQTLPIHSTAFLKSDLETSQMQFSNSLNFGTGEQARANSFELFEDPEQGENRIPTFTEIPTKNISGFVRLENQSIEKPKYGPNYTIFDISLIDKYVEKKIKQTIDKEKGKQKQTMEDLNRRKRDVAPRHEIFDGGKFKSRNRRSDDDRKNSQQISRESENFKFHEKKRPIGRITGLDFLTRYQKKNRKPNEKVSDFWKVSKPDEKTHRPSKPDKKEPVTKKFVFESTTKPFKNFISQSAKHPKQIPKFSPDKTLTGHENKEVKSAEAKTPVTGTGKLRIIVTPAPPSKTTDLTKNENYPKAKTKPKKMYRISLAGSRKKQRKSETKLDFDKSEKEPYLSEVSSIKSQEKPFKEAIIIKVSPLTEKDSPSDEYRSSRQQTSELGSINRGSRAQGGENSEQVTSQRPNYGEFALTEVIDPRKKSTAKKTLEIDNFKYKTPQYSSIERDHRGTTEAQNNEIWNVFPTRPSFHGYLIQSPKSIETEEQLKVNEPQIDEEKEHLRRKQPQYSLINRNREPWKNQHSEEVTSARPSYGEFEKSFTSSKPEEFDSKSTTEKAPENSKSDENETLRTSEPDGGKEDVGKESEDDSEHYSDGPILYYIINEKTGHGRWISYPSERQIRKFQNLKKRRKHPIANQ